MSYNLADLINITFRAKKKTPIYASASDTAQPVRYVAAGSPIGVLYSWLDPAAGRSTLWFMFMDTYGRPYYVPYNDSAGWIDTEFFREQGVLTTYEKIQEQKEQEEEENKTWLDKLMDRVVPLAGIAIAGGLLIKYINSKPVKNG